MLQSIHSYNPTYWLKQITSGDLAEFVPEVIDEAIQTYFEPELRGRSLVTVQRASSPYISWYKMVGGTGASIASEGGEPPRITVEAGKYTVRVHKLDAALEVTREHIEDNGLNVYARALQYAVRVVARKENYHIFTVLNNGVANGVEPFIGDVYDTHILDATKFTAANLDHEKIQYLISILEEEGYQPTAALMHPAQFLQLQLLTEFKDTNGTIQFLPSDAEAMVSRAVRRAFGLPAVQVVVDPFMPKDTLLMFDKTEYAELYEVHPLSIDRIPDNLRWIEVTAIRERVGAVARNPVAAAKIINLSYADITTKLS